MDSFVLHLSYLQQLHPVPILLLTNLLIVAFSSAWSPRWRKEACTSSLLDTRYKCLRKDFTVFWKHTLIDACFPIYLLALGILKWQGSARHFVLCCQCFIEPSNGLFSVCFMAVTLFHTGLLHIKDSLYLFDIKTTLINVMFLGRFKLLNCLV